MKKIYLLRTALVLVFASHLNAQISFNWAKQFGGASAEAGNSIKTDASGNVYTTGKFMGTCDFDPGAATFNLTSNGSIDVFVSKTDASGNFVWAKSIGGSALDEGNAITLDVNGNVYVTGYFEVTVDFDPGAGISNLTSGGNGDCFVLKLDAGGNFVWAKQFSGSGTEKAHSIVTDAAGDIYFTGEFYTSVDFDPSPGTLIITPLGSNDAFVCKINASGNLVWVKQFGGPSSINFSNSIYLDNSNNVYVSGFFTGTSDFDPGVTTFNLVSFGGEDIFILKLDGSGNFVWAKNTGSNLNDNGRSIIVDGAGNVYTTGVYQSIADFDPSTGTFTLTSAGGDDIFINKLDATGNFVWTKSIGSTGNDIGNSIALDAAGNVYVTGEFRSTVDFDPGVGTLSLTAAGSASDAFILKLASNGNFLWAGQIGGAASTDDRGLAIEIGSLNNIYITGSFLSTVDFDPEASSFNMTSGSLDDIFILKLNQCSFPAAPTNSTAIANQFICNGNTTTLIAIGSGTVSWFNLPAGGTALFTGTNFVSPVLTTGTYTYYAANTTTCSESINRTPVTVTVNLCTGVSDNEATQNNMNVFPNPFNDKLNVQLAVPLQGSQIELYNLLGTLVYSDKITSNLGIDMSQHPKGVYFIRIGTNEKMITKKIIKE